jgi:hypothetical protein
MRLFEYLQLKIPNYFEVKVFSNSIAIFASIKKQERIDSLEPSDDKTTKKCSK